MQTKSMSFNILIYKDEEYNIYVAHCLELDLVATSNKLKTVQHDILDIIKTHVTHAFENDNVQNMYQSAPKEIWERYYRCNETHQPVVSSLQTPAKSKKFFIPPTISTSICEGNFCNA